MWDLPGPGLEPMSPALAGGFLTTAPPGKPSQAILNPLMTFMKTCPDVIYMHKLGQIYVWESKRLQILHLRELFALLKNNHLLLKKPQNLSMGLLKFLP